jgi:hypothetical protein
MQFHLLAHHAPATNGAPETTAVGFASLIFFTLTLPFVELSSGGTTMPDILIHMVRGAEHSGFNIFALVLFFMPIIGIAVALTAHSSWRLATMIVALVGFLLVPISLATLGHGLRSMTQGTETLRPGLGSYTLMLGYGILTVTMAVTAFRARHEDAR